MKYTKILIAGSFLIFSGSALAATDGALGATSSGSSVVTVIKQNAVQISNVDDLTFPSLAVMDGTNNSLDDDVCVFNSTGSYAVTVTSNNPNFELLNGTNAIGYGVTWNGVDATTGQLTGLTGDSTSTNCSGGTNANFEVTVSVADFNSAAPGTYTDTLTLAIVPE
jgi:spore coat protein U-like protein